MPNNDARYPKHVQQNCKVKGILKHKDPYCDGLCAEGRFTPPLVRGYLLLSYPPESGPGIKPIGRGFGRKCRSNPAVPSLWRATQRWLETGPFRIFLGGPARHR